ncbi:hypothetical protein [Streptomyces sp. NPDC096068]|uniref:WXG100 family type VII secretion target n=1 Tax=Streptomyces sp. NPDC096068 TaxID=3155424 RepID=UPI00331F4BB2
MTTYTVSMVNVQSVVEEMATISGNIKTMLDTLAEDTTVNLGQWTSEARTHYDVCKRNWDNAALDMVTQAGRAHAALGKINTNYGQGEVIGTRLWEL